MSPGAHNLPPSKYRTTMPAPILSVVPLQSFVTDRCPPQAAMPISRGETATVEYFIGNKRAGASNGLSRRPFFFTSLCFVSPAVDGFLAMAITVKINQRFCCRLMDFTLRQPDLPATAANQSSWIAPMFQITQTDGHAGRSPGLFRLPPSLTLKIGMSVNWAWESNQRR